MIGQILLNRYRIDTLLGQGGTSDVFKSFDLTLQRTVAVKMLTRSVDIADRAYERFLREAQHTSRLSHPNIVSIFDYGVFDDTNPFLVTEYLDGPTLQDILDKDTKIAVPRGLIIFKQIAEGLSHAHSTGIVHRDVKPSNVLLPANIDGNDFVKIIDFGFVHVVAPGNEMQKLTLEDGILGTAFYVSPEQCSGKVADERSDIYALGCLMYECISGMVPICGENLLETFQMHIHDAPEKLSAVFEDELPIGLEALIMSCLEKSPANRPQSMKQVAASISECMNARMSGETGSRESLVVDGAKKIASPTEEGDLENSNTESVKPAPDIKPVKSKMRLAVVAGAILMLGLSATFAMTDLSSKRKHSDETSNTARNSPDQQSAASSDESRELRSASINSSKTTSGVKGLSTTSGDKGLSTTSGENSLSTAPGANSPNATTLANSRSDSKGNKAEEVDHLVTLAKECHAQGKCDEAVELLERSVQVSSKVYGPNSKETKARIKDLAVMYLTLGMQKEADQLMSKIGAM